MGLDLRYLRPQLEELLLVDECEIWEDPEGTTDDLTDPTTGAVNAIGRLRIAITPCKVKATYRQTPVNESGAPNTVSYNELTVPADLGVSVRAGCEVRINQSVHRPDLVGQWYRLTEKIDSSLAIFLKFRLEKRERQRDRP